MSPRGACYIAGYIQTCHPSNPTPPPTPLCPAACQDPALLRLAVNTVRDQCQAGRQLSDEQAAQLVDAAGRAFLGGF